MNASERAIMQTINIRLKLFLVMLCTTSVAHASPVDKSSYHLFNPVPKAQMRDMSTDRPDKTESPYTVDAGHYQVETSFIDYTYDHRNADGSDQRRYNFSVFPTNFKAGLLNNMDLQVVVDPYIDENSRGDDAKEHKRGFGDIQTRLKMNAWGNDDGRTALAVMPFIKFPSNTGGLGNKAIEGGIIVPFAVALPAEWNLGLMTEFDFNRNEDKDYFTDYINTITLGHQIIGDLSGYVEFFSSINNEADSPWVGTVDAGLMYAVSADIQLDLGVNVGVTTSADDLNPFMGCSIRY